MADSYVIYTASGSTDTFNITFGYLDPEHVSVAVDNVDASFTFPTAAQVQLAVMPTAGARVSVYRTTPRDSRQVVWQNAANLTADDLNTSDLQMLYITQEAFDTVEDAIFKDTSGRFDAEGIRIVNVGAPVAPTDASTKAYVDAATVDIVEDAEAARDASEGYRDECEGFRDETLGYRNDAATSATQAQTAVEGIPYRDVVFITAAQSPYTVDDTHRGKMLSVDTSAGNVVINLPAIAAITAPYTIGVKKATSDTNTVTINRASTDTIDLGADYVIRGVAGVNLVADTDTSPDRWTSAGFGASAGEVKAQTFVATTDFTAGSTTTLTLTNTPVSPSSAALLITFDGVMQHPSEWSYDPSTGVITFDEAIPLGVGQVFAQWQASSVSLGTPSDGTVSWVKLASSVIASVAEIVSGAANKLVSASALKTVLDTTPAMFTSARLGTLAGATNYSVSQATHGMTNIINVDLVIVCEVADTSGAGYSVGDRLWLSKYDYDGGRNNVVYRSANGDVGARTAATPTVPSKAGATATNITVAQWGVYIVLTGR